MDITWILEIVVTVLLPILVTVTLQYVKSKTTAQQRAFIVTMVKTAVQAAEQITGLKTGSDKKSYVMQYLNGKGLSLGMAELNAMIESAVFEINQSLKGWTEEAKDGSVANE